MLPTGRSSRSPLGRLVQALPSLEKEILLLREFVRPGDVCLDVGASYGVYTVPLARLVGSGGWVHAFEPRRRSATVLRTAVRALTPGNVAVHPVALGDGDGTEVIVTPRRRWFLPVPGRTFLKAGLARRADGYYRGWRREFGGAVEQPVTITTADGFVERHGIERVAFMKVDVEGAEQRVFAGAATTLAAHRPVVLCELEDRHTRKYGTTADDVVARMRGHGYAAHVFRGGFLHEVGRVTRGENNYLFLPSR